MVYREFGKTGIRLSALGFGAMRLPMAPDGLVDYDKAVPLLHRAFELGVNYVDTAPGYCNQDSETAVGKAVRGRRDQVYISTKNPVEDASGDHWRARLEGSLRKLDTDYIDFYHMWGINLEQYRTVIDVPDGPLAAALRALDEGLIRHLSFSFHDAAKNMRPLIDTGCFSSVLCQYNLLDRSNEEAMRYASEQGLGVVVMGPVAGGRLGAPSETIRRAAGRDFSSTAEMALRFVLANPHVNMALSGMENEAMVEENARVASVEGPLSAEERDAVLRMLEENKKLAELYCTGCRYCMPCPQKINIPRVFELMNLHRVYGLTDHARGEYRRLAVPLDERGDGWYIEQGLDASRCVSCGACEKKCPQHLEVIRQLRETHAVLSGE